MTTSHKSRPIDAARAQTSAQALGADRELAPAPSGALPAFDENGGAGTTASVPRSGNQRTDGLLSGIGWSGGRITYSDPDSVSDYQATHPESFSNFAQLSADQSRTVSATLDSSLITQSAGGAGFSVEGFTNLSVGYAGSGSGEGTLRLANTSDPATAYAYYPSAGVWGGDVFFGNSGRLPAAGNYDYLTTVHEIGHALGLKHGQETNVYGALPFADDAMEFSVMTYRSFVDAGLSGYTNERFGYAQTFMMLDIAALQHMYGADYSTNSGDTTYSWNPLNGQTSVNGAIAIAPGGNRIFQTVWDGGGSDTYDLSDYATNLNVDLGPGGHSTFSSAQAAYLGGGPNGGYARGNVFNALEYQGDPRSLIENAIGGSGDDLLRGNSASNRLSGQSGDDILRGAAGDDSLDGGTGTDMLHGHLGDDFYYVDRPSDRAIESASAGIDTVYATSSFALEANVEALHLTGTGAANATGNTLNNLVSGNASANVLRGLGGNDTLQSGNGADVLIGGLGNDVFKFAGTVGSTSAARDVLRFGDGAVAFERPGGLLGDRFDLSLIDANASRSGVQDFVFGTATATGRLWAEASGALTVIRGNVDADRAAEFEIAVDDGAVRAAAYTSADFLV